ncbi:uncharacterized protein BYT42DRAFT_586815 [Radiomyces spectabilis]|uniref:uncharacterized protein n=1 Tax=Radiomyces spectabilis TaxID=64574 RepID=UPI0022211FFA|nr:uncharacterized protein BYT42DRAFT_586815 [Radiomyces spectabilis]KAI8367590.1 hypothetical protein BYT42DRAFT_586815 [Radiomyces spectabilis]
MANPSTNDILFIIIIVIAFFIIMGLLVYIFHKATSPTKREVRQFEQQMQQYYQSSTAPQVQYITASELEAMKPSLLKQLYAQDTEKRQSLLQKLTGRTQKTDTNAFSPPSSVPYDTVTRPSSVRPPSFRPMPQAGTGPHSSLPMIVVVNDDHGALTGRRPHPAAPPAYGDHRSSALLHCDSMPIGYTGKE